MNKPWYQKLLDIFIEPRIYYTYEENKTKTPVRKRIDLDYLINEQKNQLISGDAGTGKSTLLKKLGEKLISQNAEGRRKNLPIFISATEIFEYEYLIVNVLLHKLESYFGEINDEFFANYKIIVLVDSIDELKKDIQKKIIKELKGLSKDRDVKYVIGTRNHEKVSTLFDDNGFNIYQIEKFNNDQIKKFVAQFFLKEKNKANELVNALKENRIIERMPVTPLTLSLISILYEENNLEIPATIADIYDNFNSLIIGRSTVTSNIEFIDISFKERILSLYALHLLEKENHTPLTKEEFFTHFLNYYKGKTLPIRKGTLEEVLNYLIEHTGIIVIKENKWVKFSHDSYMEYYGAVEIFKHQREKEVLLVKNFLDHNWQNTSIFYAGKSKDLPLFLEKIINRVKEVHKLQDCFVGVLGIGYLLQALFQTDNMLRKQAVLEALRLSVNSYETTLKLASDNPVLFKNHKLPILQLMNLMYFYENFNSLTVKAPLKLAFDDVYAEFVKSNHKMTGYKAVKLALTLDSNRINDDEALSVVTENNNILKDPSLYLILDFGLDILGKDKYKALKTKIKKDYFHKLSEPIKQLIELPAGRLRFSDLNSLQVNRNVQLVVEGITDAEIIEHAFYVLTNGSLPYWGIKQAGNISGGANEVAKTLLGAKPIIDDKSVLIGIFDHDAKGLQEYRGLKKTLFSEQGKDLIKKHNSEDIFAICLPIPGNMDYYLQKEQEFNYFAIEHYFEEEFLEECGVIENSPIPRVKKVKDSKKKSFSKFIRGNSDPNVFKNFLELFRIIDEISKADVDYELT